MVKNDGNGVDKVASYVWAAAFAAWAGVILAAWYDISDDIHVLNVTVIERMGELERRQAVMKSNIDHHTKEHETGIYNRISP